MSSSTNDLRRARVGVVGAGVAGLCLALELQNRGARVVLTDPGDRGGNASAIAAGMIAPAFEAAADDAGRFPLFRAARDLWPRMAGGAVRLRRAGAAWVALPGGPPGELEAVVAALDREGARRGPPPPDASGLARRAAGDVVFTPEDWSLDPAETLDLLLRSFVAGGGEFRRARVIGVEAGGIRLAEERLCVEAAVVCAGWGSRALLPESPELGVLTPIKGQLIRFAAAGLRPGPTVRTRDGYLAPGSEGLVAGATMESGVSDLELTASAQSRFARLAAQVHPELKNAAYAGAAGVRAATPDGLPLAGRSESGVWLLTGFRRNGWLLAPLAARIAADLLAGRDPGPWAEPMRPDRFSRA